MIIWSIILIIACCFAVYIFVIRDYQLFRKVTNQKRGTITERNLVRQLVKYGIPHQTIFHDLYLKKNYDSYTQIDIVVATKAGIIVFEVKKLSGWIFGSGSQRYWTQVLNYGKEKHRLYNPIIQNRNHIIQLKKKLTKENIPFFSVVVFYGDCQLKNIDYIPSDTYLAKSNKALIVFEKIIRENEPVQYTDKREIVRVLQEAVDNGEDNDIRFQHIQKIKDDLGKDRIFQ